jgi:ABC-type phosphate/phosphonate transport system ATPase subunit
MPTSKAQQIALEALKQVDAEALGLLRNNQCSPEQRFIVKLIRAAMVQYAKIVITMPFNLIDDSRNIDFFIDLFRRLDIMEHVVILDMLTNRNKYEEEAALCHIIA